MLCSTTAYKEINKHLWCSQGSFYYTLVNPSPLKPIFGLNQSKEMHGLLLFEGLLPEISKLFGSSSSSSQAHTSIPLSGKDP